MQSQQKIGRWGEDLAAAYLQQHGYQIIERNIRTAYGEIDLLARQAECLVFVEVKTRRSNSLGPPEISISNRKQSHMQAAAQAYIQSLLGVQVDWRIDVVAVRSIAGQQPEIVHFENVIASGN